MQQHQSWIVNGESETASNGNLGPLSMNLFLNWLTRAWTHISSSEISALFNGSPVFTNGHQKQQKVEIEFDEEVQRITGGNNFLDKIIEEVNQELADTGDLNNFIKETSPLNS
jgi:hypothetical protein